MRLSLTSVLLPILVIFGCGWAAEKNPPSDRTPSFSLASTENETGASKFSDAQIVYVQSWIKQIAPECPESVSAVVADLFLNELQVRRPEKLHQLLTPDFPAASLESMLLRHVAAKLTGPTQATLREELARRRIAAVLASGGREGRAASADAAGLMAKIKDNSPAQHRRLLEGKMDDDDLELLLKKSSQVGAGPKETGPSKPKALTAADIVSEFSRRNQAGSALLRLQAYSVEGRLRTAAGEEQELLLFKMRPNRFRLVVRTAGLTRYILSYDGNQFWQQAPGQAPQVVPAEKMGARLHLAEFVDPLFVGEGFTFERRDDGERDGRKFHRIAVKRPDGSGYVACIDTETYREISRENDDHALTRYSDFREVGGVTYAFREEAADPTGKKAAFEVTRIVPNPGLIQDLFDLPARQNAGYFQIEQLLAPAAVRTVAQSK